MEIELFEDAIDDFNYWKESGNKAIQNKIHLLFEDMIRHPFSGIGKPELLKHNLTGKWSGRINEEHRIIYDVINEKINVYSLRGHYIKKK